MVISGWRAALIVIAVLVVLGLLLTAIFWLALIVAAGLVVAWFNWVVLPRLAARTHLPQLVLAAALAVVLGGVGFVLGGMLGAVEGAALWALAVAAPRVVMWRVHRRLGRRARTEPVTIILPSR